MAGVACAAAFCVAGIDAAPTFVAWWPTKTAPMFYWEDWWTYTWFRLPRVAGYSVALTWLVLFLSGRWAADQGWLDRFGRFLGVCWIGLALLSVLGSSLRNF